jgi:hypothetical protein
MSGLARQLGLARSRGTRAPEGNYGSAIGAPPYIKPLPPPAIAVFSSLSRCASPRSQTPPPGSEVEVVGGEERRSVVRNQVEKYLGPCVMSD